jgi:putative lipoprotein
MSLRGASSVLVAAAFLSACPQAEPPLPIANPNHLGLLSGTVTYRERMALPPNASVTVRVWDAMEPPTSSTIGETTFVAQGQVPLPFQLFFAGDLIQASHTYGARASISVDGVVWFQTETPVPVLTNGAPNVEVELLVKRVTPPP